MSFLRNDKRVKYTGAVNDNGYLACEECGSKKIQITHHFDGRDCYGDGGHCTECGHPIQIMYKRNGGLWDDSEVKEQEHE